MNKSKNHNREHHDQLEMQEQALAELTSVFDKMPNETPLLLIPSVSKNEQINDAARKFIRTIKTFTSYICI